VDETGQPDGPPPGANGNGSGDRNEPRLRGWAYANAGSAVPDDAPGSFRSPLPRRNEAESTGSWSNAGAALEPPAEPAVPGSPLSGWRTVAPQRPEPSLEAYGHRYADLLAPLAPPPPPPIADPEPWAPSPVSPSPSQVAPSQVSAPPHVPQQYAVPPLPPQHVPPQHAPEHVAPQHASEHVPAAAPPLPTIPPVSGPPFGEPDAYAATPPGGLPAYSRVNGFQHSAVVQHSEDADAEPAPWADALPQRVPAEPDVPTLPEPVTEDVEERAEAGELARIATYLRHEEPTDRPVRRESLDVGAVLAAVRGVYGVRDAELRTNPGGVHSLRLDLADGADAGLVSREVARLLKERLGLAAALGSRTGTQDRIPVRLADGVYQGRRRPATGYDSPRPQPQADFERSTARGRATVEPRTESTAVPPLPRTGEGVRILLDHVQVSTFGLDSTVEVRLGVAERRAVGEAKGPAVDGYVLRLAAVAAANAIDLLLVAESTGASKGRCFVEHASVVPFGTCEVAVVVILLVCGGWVEQLAGSALVAGDPRQAIVRATLSAVNRRIEALLT